MVKKKKIGNKSTNDYNRIKGHKSNTISIFFFSRIAIPI